MEQGLEAPVPGTDAGNRDGRAVEQSSTRGSERKGVGARRAVKGKVSNDRPPDACPQDAACWQRHGRPCSCRRRESFEGRKGRAGELRFATRGNRANPRIGSRVKQTCRVEEDQTVEVVRNHAGGTREGLAVLLRREARQRESQEADSLASGRWRGDLWKNPREDVRLEGRTARIGMRRKSRRQGQEGCAHMLTHFAAPDRRDLEGPGAESVEGRGGERRSQQPRKRSGISPRGGIEQCR